MFIYCSIDFPLEQEAACLFQRENIDLSHPGAHLRACPGVYPATSDATHFAAYPEALGRAARTSLYDERRCDVSLQELSQQYTLKETADLLKCSKRHIEKLCARGELPSIGQGRLRRVTLADIREWQRRNRNDGGLN